MCGKVIHCSANKLLATFLVFTSILIIGYIVLHQRTVLYTYDGQVNNILYSNYQKCVNIQNNNFQFTQKRDDPQIFFSGIQDEFAGIKIVLKKPANQKMKYQLFWSNGDLFQESSSYTGYIEVGEFTTNSPIEKGNWKNIRFDMDGVFTLQEFSTLESSFTTYIIEPSKLPKIILQSIVFLLIYGIAIAVHIHKSKKQKNYVLSLLGQCNKFQTYAYDYLRVLAVIMVICTHAIQSDMDKVNSGGLKFYIMTLVYVLCLGCNLIYVMLSGALLLQYKEEKISSFYFRRTTRVALPMLIYYVLYIWKDISSFGFSSDGIQLVFERLFTGYTPEAPHYWLMYVLLSLYIIFPFFRYMFKHMSYEILTKFISVIFLFMAISIYLPVIYKEFAVSSFISSWIGVAVIGYWLSKKETRKYDTLLIWMGILSIIITALLIKFQISFLELTTNSAPTMVLFSCGIFAFALKSNGFFLKRNVLISFFSKYSYSIILIHWWVLHFITRQKLHIYTFQLKFIGGLFLSLTLTLFISAFLAFLIDNLLLVTIEKIFLSSVSCSRILVTRIRIIINRCLSSRTSNRD